MGQLTSSEPPIMFRHMQGKKLPSMAARKDFDHGRLFLRHGIIIWPHVVRLGAAITNSTHEGAIMPQGRARSTNKETISKMDAVRHALNELGPEAKPLQMKPWIQKRYGIDMEANMISSYKSSLNKEAAGQSGISRRGRGAGRGAAGDLSLQDIQAVKQLSDRIGADKVRELAGLFG